MDRRHRTHLRQSGFTLIELLVAMAIIATLASLAVGAAMKMRERATKATAVTGIANIKMAIGAYHSRAGIYPNAGQTAADDDPEALFKALYTGDPKLGGTTDNHLEGWPTERIALWSGAYLDDPDAYYDRPDEDQLDFSGGNYTACVFLDPWERPYHFVEWDSLPRSQRSLGSDLKAKGGHPFAIWSDGPNKTNDWGKEDDIVSW